MTYRLNDNTGDSVAVPQLVFRHLDRAGGDPVRVALYMIATRCTDPKTIAHDLKLKTVASAQSALEFWHGVGLLEKEQGGAATPPSLPTSFGWPRCGTPPSPCWPARPRPALARRWGRRTSSGWCRCM